MDPPVSEPSAPAQRPAATATPEPEEEPAGARVTSHGLRPVGKRPSRAGRPKAHSCMVSLPSITAPAACSRSVTKASRMGTWSASTSEPPVMRTPATAMRSLRASGTPWSGPRRLPRDCSVSAARARDSAVSRITVM
jgi:hypothetical protein